VSALRFAMVTTFYPPHNFGGDGIAIQRLSRALVRRGHHVTVFHDTDAFRLLAPGAAPEAQQEPPGLEVRRLRSALGRISPLLTHQVGRPVVHGRRIRRELLSGGFDVVHFHNVSLVGGPGILASGSGLKVYEAHDHWLVCPTHVLWRHGREPCTERQCVRCVLRHRRPLQLWRNTAHLERQLRHVDVFIAKSEFSRRKHREFGFPRDMEVVPYFLPGRETSLEPASSPHPRPYFLFVGRLERIKGLDEVIPAFGEYREADLLVAGDGEHGRALRALADGMPRVQFLGTIDAGALDAYYQHAIALVVPSVCFETFGIVLIEAFRHGKPVIARRIGPFPEIIDQSAGGLLFDDNEQLVAAMDRLLRDDALRRRMEAAARDSFSRLWSEDVVVPRYLQILGRAAERRGMTRLAKNLELESAA
jgi:glycosyltransferase involved in cell wall biosynthesis